MLRHKTYQFRISPNQVQQVLIAKTIGCSRFVYNHFLDLWNKAYAKTKKGLSYNACSAMLPNLKQAEATHDRDLNASKNILKEGLRLHAQKLN